MNVTGIVFTNDASLGELTTKRTMASLPFGGRYRQVDWALSNLACAGVRHIGIISRHNYQSLMNHIGDGKTGPVAHKLRKLIREDLLAGGEAF